MLSGRASKRALKLLVLVLVCHKKSTLDTIVFGVYIVMWDCTLTSVGEQVEMTQAVTSLQSQKEYQKPSDIVQSVIKSRDVLLCIEEQKY